MNEFHRLEEKLKRLGIKPFGTETFQGLLDHQLESIEGLLASRLPDNYRRFLSRYGESGFSEDVYFPLGAENELVEFGYFFGFDSIEDGISSPPDTMPETMFPIGDEGMGNLYCLGFAGDDIGKVFYWDTNIGSELDPDDLAQQSGSQFDASSDRCVIQIANSFEQFIDLMVIR